MKLRILADSFSEGIQSDASNGSLIIKPCTPAEIAFYESASQHEAFQTHMPTYYGKLTLNADQSANALVPEVALNNHGLSSNRAGEHLPTTVLANGLMSPISPHTSFQNSTPTHSQSATSKRTSWKPSGGKKLDTGFAVVLENVAHGFTRPNILDIKLGARLWADDAPIAKRVKLDEICRQTTSGSLGFRIAGMTVWKGTTEESIKGKPSTKDYEMKNGYRRYDRDYGRTLTQTNVKDGFLEYLGGVDPNGKLKSRRSLLIAKRIARELRSIKWVLGNEESRMYSASILMVYEGDEQALEAALREEDILRTSEAEEQQRNIEAVPDTSAEDNDDNDDDDEDEDIVPKVHDVRLIDFAHAQWTPGQGPDENVLHGVRSVLAIFNEIAKHGAA